MNIPDNFLDRMKEYLGDEYEELASSYSEPEVKGLRVNAIGDLSPIAYFDEKYRRDFAKEGDISGSSECIFERIKWEEHGYLCKATEFERIAPGKHPYHEAGEYYIQEPSAMAPVFYLDAKPHDRILDLCASPGGKSTQIGSKMQNKGILISNEINSSRAKVLSENIERMGIRNAVVINEDPRRISDKLECFFDKVLVDAPCSGEGMFRHSDTAIDEWSADNVLMCAKRQSLILDEAAKLVKDGGMLVYSTCTFSKEENENNITAFLMRHPEFSLCEMQLFDGMVRGFDGVGVRLYPHRIKGEGHYVCKLEKSYVNNSPIHPHFDNQCLSSKDRQKLAPMFSFISENITGAIKDEIASKNFILFGDNIYMLPDDCPSLKGIKVLRLGLHIGTLKKDRFEPAHALAMTLRASDVKSSINISLNGNNNSVIYKYLNGEAFNISDVLTDDPPNHVFLHGFTLICVDGFSLGWGKAVGGTVKNHYPKGLRKQIRL